MPTDTLLDIRTSEADPMGLSDAPVPSADDGSARDKAVLEASVLKAGDSDVGIGDIFEDIDTEVNISQNSLLTGQDIVNAALQEERDQRAQAMGDLISEMRTVEDYDLVRQFGPNYLSKEMTLVDAIAENYAQEGISPERVASLANQYKLYEKIRAAKEERSWLGVADDWADYLSTGALVTGDYDNFLTQQIENRVLELLTGKEGNEDDPLGVGEELYAIARAFQSGDMDVEQAEFIGENLWEFAMQATDGNVSRAQDIVDLFLNEFTSEGMAAFKTLEALDLTGVASFLARLTMLGVRAGRSSMPDFLNTMGAESEAAAVLNAAANNPRIAKAANIEGEAILDSVHPVSNTALNPGATDLVGVISKETEIASNTILEDIVKSADDLALEAYMDVTKQNAFRAAWLEKKDRYVQSLNAEKNAIADVELVETGSDSFLARVHYVDGTQAVKELAYKKDELGFFNVAPLGIAEKYTASPHHKFNRFAEQMVPDSIFNREQATILRNKFSNAYWEVMNPIKKSKVDGVRSMDRVEAVLVAGDKWGGEIGTTIKPIHGKVFPESVLEVGVETNLGTIKLNAAERKAYREMRQITDAMQELKGREMVQAAIRADHVETVVFEVTPEGMNISKAVHGKVVNKGEIEEGDLVYQAGRGDAGTTLTKTDLDKIPDDHVILKLDSKGGSDSVIQIGNDYFGSIVVPRASIRTVTRRSVDQVQPGWYPRGYDNVAAWVRVLTPSKYNGRQARTLAEARGPQVRTVSHSSSFKAIERDLANGKLTNIMRNAGLTDEQIKTGRGTYWDIDTDKAAGGGIDLSVEARTTSGHRNRYPLYDHTGDGAMAPQRALAAAISNVSNQYAKGQWFETKSQIWTNTAMKAGLLEDPSKGFLSPIKKQPADFQGVPGIALARGMEDMRKWLNEVSGVVSSSQREWQAWTLNAAKSLEGMTVFGKDGPEAIRKIIMKLGHTNPFDSAKSAAFHAFLGVLNVAQLAIQASQFTIAFALNPTRAVSHLQKGLGLRFYLNTFRSDKDLARGAKVAGMSKSEFRSMLEAYDRSGIEQGVKQTGDYARIRDGGTLTQGMADRLLSGGLWFFKEGELFARTYAFLNSGADFFESAGKKSWQTLSEDDLRTIHAGMQRQMFMLDKNNKAFFQQGALAVPTQFWQIATKSAEAMGLMPGSIKAGVKFGGRERIKIVAGQAVLFGSAGVPFFDFLVTNGAAMFGSDPADVSNETKALVGRGITGFMQQYAFGTEVDIADRVAVISSIEGVTESLFGVFAGDKPASEISLNAFGSLLGRAKDLMTVGSMYFSGPEEDIAYIDGRISKNELYGNIVLRQFLGLITSFKNAEKAYLMDRLGGIPGTSRVLLLDLGEPTRLELIGQAIGFQPLDQKFGYELQDANLRASEKLSSMANIIVETSARELKRTGSTYTDVQGMRDAITLFHHTLGLSEAEKAKLNSLVQSKYSGPQFNPIIRKALENSHAGLGLKRGPTELLTNPTETSPYFNTLLTKEDN